MNATVTTKKRKTPTMPFRLVWDAHEAKAPYESERWAISDRGWFFVEAKNMFEWDDRRRVTLGHYLDYSQHGGTTEGGTERPVHAFACTTRTARCFATVAEAQAWIEAEAKGREIDHYASERQARGMYLHEADEIRRQGRLERLS